MSWRMGRACASQEPPVRPDEADGLVLKIELDAKGRVTRASAVPVTAGLQGKNARLAEEPQLLLDLLESLGARPTRRLADRIEF